MMLAQQILPTEAKQKNSQQLGLRSSGKQVAVKMITPFPLVLSALTITSSFYFCHTILSQEFHHQKCGPLATASMDNKIEKLNKQKSILPELTQCK